MAAPAEPIGDLGGPTSVPEGYPADLDASLRLSTNDARRYMWAWSLCQRFIAGDQYVAFNQSSQAFIPVAAQPGKNSCVVNLIRPRIRAKIAQLDIAYPDVAIMPSAPSEANIRQATATEEVWHYLWYAKGVKDTLMRAIEFAIEIGTSALHTFMDPQTGDFVTEAKRAFDIRFEEGAVDIGEASWIAIRSVVKLKALQAAYPEKAHLLSALSKTSVTDRYINAGSIDAIPKDSVEMWDVYWKDGRHAVFSCGEYLWTEMMPDGILPVQVIYYHRYDDRIWGDGAVWPSIDIQRSYNRVFNRTLDMIEATSNPLWLYPVGSNASKNALSNVIGGIVSYNPAGGEPKRVPGINIPPHMIDMLRLLEGQCDNAFELHTQSYGKRAPGVNSGVAIESLVQQDQATTTYTQNSIEAAVIGLCKTYLTFVKATWTEAKAIQIYDTMGRVVHREVDASSILENPTVKIQAGTLFQADLRHQEARLKDWVALKAITPQEAMLRSQDRNYNKSRMQSMMDSYHAADILEAVKQGLAVEIYPTDPIDMIKTLFEEYMRSPDFYGEYMDALEVGDMEAMTAASTRMYDVRNAYVSLLAPPSQPAEQVAQVAQQSVYPRKNMTPYSAPPQPGNPMPATGPMAQQDIDARAGALEGTDGPDYNTSGMGGVA